MERITQVAVFCSASLIAAGCGTTAKFVYPSNPQNLVRLAEAPKDDRSVAVLPFEEARPDKNSMGGLFLYMIPLMPFGTLTYERPDAARLFVSINDFKFDVAEDLAKAAVTSLQRANLFRRVFFSYGGDVATAQLVLNGTVKSTRYRGRVFSYGLSVYGLGLSFLGLPLGSSTNTLHVALRMTRPDQPTPLWTYEFNKEATIVQGLYYRMGYDIKAYTTLMEEGMNEAIRDLDQKLPAINTQ